MQPSSPESLETADLVRELFADATLLARRQLKLAELEGRGQLRRELKSFGFMSAGGGLAYAGLILLLTAAALGLGLALGGNFWAGALIAAGFVFVLAAALGLIGWTRRVKNPLGRTRRGLNREIAWAKSQHATTWTP